MAKAWQKLAVVSTSEGALELRRRGDDEFLIVIAGRVLMTSSARRSEEALATIACQRLGDRETPRVLLGGLGMGYTLRAALDALPGKSQITIAELHPQVVEWCRGPLAPLTNSAILDKRVQIKVGDVARVIADASPSAYDAIILDLYEGPHAATQTPADPFYGATALKRTHDALATSGVLAVWSEESDQAFERRFQLAGFDVSTIRRGRGGRAHIIYLGTKTR